MGNLGAKFPPLAFHATVVALLNFLSTMAAVKIGSLTFCPECGNLLDLPTADDDIVLCNLCSFAYKTSGSWFNFLFLARKRKVSNWHVGNEEEETKVITTSSPHAFQSPLKAKRHLVQQSKQPTESAAMVFACCPFGIQWIKIAKWIRLLDQRKVSQVWQRRNGISYNAATFRRRRSNSVLHMSQVRVSV